MSTPARRQNPERKKTRRQIGHELKRHRVQLGSTIVGIEEAMAKLNGRINRSIEGCRLKGTGSVVGSVVQVPQQDPHTQAHFDYLDAVRATLEQLVNEAP